jgi:hypothetical protein
MVRERIAASGLSLQRLGDALRSVIARAPQDAVLTILIEGAVEGEARRALAASHVRRITPLSMNVEIREAGTWRGRAIRSSHQAERTASQLDLYSSHGSHTG